MIRIAIDLNITEIKLACKVGRTSFIRTLALFLRITEVTRIRIDFNTSEMKSGIRSRKKLDYTNHERAYVGQSRGLESERVKLTPN